MKKTEAIELFGGLPQLARALGVSRSAIAQWGSEVPELRVYQIREILRNREILSNRERSSNG